MTEQSEKSEQFSLVEQSDILKNGLRIRPVQFAEVMGISKGRVSQLIKAGTIKVGVDGLIDLNKAAKSYFESIDLKRVRNRLLRPIADDLEAIKTERDELQKQVVTLQNELSSLKEEADELEQVLAKEYWYSIEREKSIEQFMDYLAMHFTELNDCDDPAELLRSWWATNEVGRVDEYSPEIDEFFREADELFSAAEQSLKEAEQ